MITLILIVCLLGFLYGFIQGDGIAPEDVPWGKDMMVNGNKLSSDEMMYASMWMNQDE
jgi:hypothetical protein